MPSFLVITQYFKNTSTFPFIILKIYIFPHSKAVLCYDINLQSFYDCVIHFLLLTSYFRTPD